MDATFGFVTTYDIRCAAQGCNESHLQVFATYAGNPQRMPYLPDRWVVAQGRTYCPKHHIVLVVDHTQRVGIAGDPRLTKASEGICT